MTKEGKIAVMTIVMKTEEVLGLSSYNSLKALFDHWYGDTLISVDFKESLEEDKRMKAQPPAICQKCKNCHNKQCWFGDTYNADLDGDCDVCFEPKDESIDKQAILDKYWENIYKLAKRQEEQDVMWDKIKGKDKSLKK